MQAERGLGYVKQILLGLVEAALEATVLRVRPPRGQFYASLPHTAALRSANRGREMLQFCYTAVISLLHACMTFAREIE